MNLTSPERRVLLAVRAALAALWAYEGLWLKVLAQDPHEVRIVGAALSFLPLNPKLLTSAIGIAETIIALVVLIGIKPRLIAWLQFLVLLTMNLVGIVRGGGEIRDPIYLIVHNLPTFACILVMGCFTQDRGTAA